MRSGHRRGVDRFALDKRTIRHDRYAGREIAAIYGIRALTASAQWP
jgi:hypothetical protein